MKHFLDRINTLSKQTVDSAIITTASGTPVGKIHIRYTEGQYGYNHEVGMLINGVTDFGTTQKGNAYDRAALFKLIKAIGGKAFDYSGNRLDDYSERKSNLQNIDSTSSLTELRSFKIGKRKFNILWA